MPNSPVNHSDSGATINVWVVPGSSRASFDGLHGDKVKVRVTSAPEGGRANEEVARILRSLTGGDIELLRGMRSREKVFQVTGQDVDTVRRKLGLM